MRIVTSAALVALLGVTTLHAQQTAAAKPAVEAASSTIKKLTRAEFDSLSTDPSHLVVIDIRRPDELTSLGGFPAYLSIQLNDLANRLAYIPKDRAVVTVSNHANRAQRAGELLKKEGFNVVGAIGVQDYEGEGGTLVKVAPPAPKATVR